LLRFTICESCPQGEQIAAGDMSGDNGDDDIAAMLSEAKIRFAKINLPVERGGIA
jgi:hypothetical protein